MENILVTHECFLLSKKFIFSNSYEKSSHLNLYKQRDCQLSDSQRYAQISARQMLCSSILLRVYGRTLLPLEILVFVMIQGWFLPAFFVPFKYQHWVSTVMSKQYPTNMFFSLSGLYRDRALLDQSGSVRHSVVHSDEDTGAMRALHLELSRNPKNPEKIKGNPPKFRWGLQ